MVAIKAKFDGKVFIPDEPPALNPGESVVLHVEAAPAADRAPTSPPVSALEWLANNAVDDDNLPADLSYQLDHYLYGTPKKP